MCTHVIGWITWHKEKKSCNAYNDDDPHDHQGDTEEQAYEAGNDDDHNDDDDASDDNPHHQAPFFNCPF